MTKLLLYWSNLVLKLMKTIFIFSILFLAFTGGLAAQNEDAFNPADTSVVIQRVGYINDPLGYLKRVDRKIIPYGTLIDRVSFKSDIFLFNGVSKVKTAEAHHLKRFYENIKYARNDSGRMFKHKDLNNIAVFKMKEKNVYPLMIMDVNFSHIKKKSLGDGSFVETDSCLLERKKSPNNYSKNRFVYASTFTPRIHGNRVTFLVDSMFFVKNNDDKILRMDLDFGDDKGYRSVSFGDKITIDYGSTSNHILAKLKLTIADSTAKRGYREFYAHFTFLRSGSDMVSSPDISLQNGLKSSPVTPSITTDNKGLLSYPVGKYDVYTYSIYGYDSNTAQYYQTDYTDSLLVRDIEYCVLMGKGNNSGKLRKPIVIVDGFDPGNKRDYYKTILTDATGDPKIDDTRGLFQLMNGDKSPWAETNSQTPQMVSDLQNNGYDVVFVNWINGDADITQNGDVFRGFLNEVLNAPAYRDNQTEEMILVGPSMGGLITRYCLATMEKAKEEHHVKLWFSFDSPQEGAYIPTSLQLSINFLSNAIDNINSRFSAFTHLDNKPANSLYILNSPAAKQMLLSHYTTLNINGAQPQSATHTPDFSKFYNQLHSLGYPLYSKNIAITNGGKDKLYQDNDNYICYFHTVKKEYVRVHLDTRGLANKNDDSRSLIFQGDAWYDATFYNSNLSSYPDDFNTNQQIGYENSPGGYNTALYTFNQSSDNDGKPSTDLVSNPQYSKACFMPTVSTFGIVPTRDNIYRTWDHINISETPFDDAHGMGDYGPEEHCRVSDKTSDWMKTYLLNERGNLQKPYLHTLHSSSYDETESKSCLYTATNSVTLGGVTGSSFTVKSGADVQVVSPSIHLKSGLKIEKGARFSAKAGTVANGAQKSASIVKTKPTVTYLDPSPYANKVYDYSSPSFENTKMGNSDFRIFPNPVENTLKIEALNNTLIGIVEIRNIYGVTVVRIDAGQTLTASVDLSTLSSGVYFVCVDGDIQHTQKIIKN